MLFKSPRSTKYFCQLLKQIIRRPHRSSGKPTSRCKNCSLNLTRALILFFSREFATILFSLKDFMLDGLPGHRFLFSFLFSVESFISWLTSPSSVRRPVSSSSTPSTKPFRNSAKSTIGSEGGRCSSSNGKRGKGRRSSKNRNSSSKSDCFS